MSGEIVRVDPTRAFALALEPNDFEQAYKVAEIVASTGLCGVTSAEDAFTRIMTGRSLGLNAMQSVRGVYNVEGRPALDASLMHAIVESSPDVEYFRPAESTNERAVWVGKRKGEPEVRVEWTLDDARRAGLLDRGKDPTKNNWNKFPRAMLNARCKSELSRLLDPGRLFGIHSREEHSDGVVEPREGELQGEVVKPAPTPSLFDTLKAKLDVSTEDDRAAMRKAVADAKPKLPDGEYKTLVARFNAKYPKGSTAKAEPAKPVEPMPSREPGQDDEEDQAQ